MPSKKLMNAIEEEDVEKVRKVLAAGANLKPSKKWEDCPVILAAAMGNEEIVKLLVEAGADVRFAEKSGWTALHEAAYNEYIEVARLLLAAGADPDAKLTERYYIPDGVSGSIKKGKTPKTIWDDSEPLKELFGEVEGGAPVDPADSIEWDITAAAVLYGRSVEIDGSAEEARSWIVELMQKAAGEGVQLECVPAGNLSYDEGEGPFEAIVGFRVVFAQADYFGGPMPIAPNAVEQAKKLSTDVSKTLWRKLLKGVNSDLDQSCQFFLVATGPLTFAMLVSGELADPEGEHDGEFFCGKDMQQEPHAEGVVGKCIASCDDHAEAFEPPKKGNSYLISQYD